MRYNFIDVARGLAVLFMIETHGINSMLSVKLKEIIFYDIITFFNGLVAPLFLFISGFTFFLTAYVKKEDYRKFRKPFWKTLFKIFFLFILGYSLHLPYPTLHNILHYTSEDQWLQFYGIDVLQCIGTGLLILLILRVLIKSDKIYSYVVLASGIIIVLLTPLINRLDLIFIPLPLLVYIQDVHYSLFPIFPWMSYILFGNFFSYLYLEHKNSNSINFSIKTVKFSLIFSILSAVLFYFILDEKPKTSYSFFMLKLSLVIVIVFTLNIVLTRYNKSFDLISKYGQYSLLAYWFHLVLLYKKIRNNQSLVDIIGNSLSYLDCFGICFIIAFCCLGLIYTWEGVKKNKIYKNITYIGGAVIVLYIFLFTY